MAAEELSGVKAVEAMVVGPPGLGAVSVWGGLSFPEVRSSIPASAAQRQLQLQLPRLAE
jgi:hypothetical protein